MNWSSQGWKFSRSTKSLKRTIRLWFITNVRVSIARETCNLPRVSLGWIRGLESGTIYCERFFYKNCKSDSVNDSEIQKFSSILKSIFGHFWAIIVFGDERQRLDKCGRSCRRMPTYDGFAYAKVKNSIFNSKMEVFVGNIDIISKDFGSLFYSTIKIWVK